MLTLEQRMDQLQQRVMVLEDENARLRERSSGPWAQRSGAVNRRALLGGGAGVVAALLGTSLVTSNAYPVAAAARSDDAHAEKMSARDAIVTDGLHSHALAHARFVGLTVSVPTQRRKGQHAASYTWDLAPYFQGDHAPIVVASAHHQYDGVAAPTAPHCAVRIEGSAGAYRALIDVSNIGHAVGEVTVQALAFGES